MEKVNKDFLVELLNTPSPTGMEQEIQKKWADYIRPFSDEIRVDRNGNVTGIRNPEAPFKVLFAAHCDEIGFIIKKIDENGYLYFTKVGGISPSLAPGMKLEIFGEKGPVTGVVGAIPIHFKEEKDKVEFGDLYIDCGFKNKEEAEARVRFGDLAVYKRAPEILENDRISGRGLDNRTGVFMMAELLRNLKGKTPKVGVYCVSTISEETNAQGAYGAGAAIKPDVAVVCDVTFATDHPGVDKEKHGDVKLGEGPALGIGPALNKKTNDLLEKIAKEKEIKLQYELYTSSTGTDGDKLRYTGNGVPITLVSLPLRYMHSPVETASVADMEAQVQLLTEWILSLNGDEILCPVVL